MVAQAWIHPNPHEPAQDRIHSLLFWGRLFQSVWKIFGRFCKLYHQAGSDSQVGPQSSHSVGMNSRTFTVLRTSRLFSKQKMPAVIQVNICAMICACHPSHLTWQTPPNRVSHDFSGDINLAPSQKLNFMTKKLEPKLVGSRHFILGRCSPGLVHWCHLWHAPALHGLHGANKVWLNHICSRTDKSYACWCAHGHHGQFWKSCKMQNGRPSAHTVPAETVCDKLVFI